MFFGENILLQTLGMKSEGVTILKCNCGQSIGDELFTSVGDGFYFFFFSVIHNLDKYAFASCCAILLLDRRQNEPGKVAVLNRLTTLP